MRLVPVTIKLDEETLERIDRLAKQTDRNRSVIVREALEKYLENIGSTNEQAIGNTYGQTISNTDGRVIGNTNEQIYEQIIGNTESLGLSEKLELFKRLGTELVELCKEQKRKLRREYPRVSLFELIKYTDCPKIRKAIGDLLVDYSENVWTSKSTEA